MGTRGGKRPNAGRKKGSKASHTLEAETLRKYLIEQIIKEKEPIIQALMDKCKKGDIPAIKESFERALGKVKEEMNINITAKIKKLKEIDDNLRKVIG